MDRPEGPLPLPPLSALRTFEAAARHGSFTRAARELCVTQTAVSHQVRQLEETLGGPLFSRQPRRIELTDLGRAWATAMHPVFSALYEANRALRRPPAAGRPTVAITVVPSFATCWLVPRLGDFFARHPLIDLHLSPSHDLVDIRGGAFDLAIRYGPGRYPGTATEKLSDDAWIPVAAPKLMREAALRRPADLSRTRLIRDDEDAWAGWLARHGISCDGMRWGPVMTDSSMILDAVVRGQGVGLLRVSLAHDALTSGRLVRLFPRIAAEPSAWSYFLVRPRGRTRPEVDEFCQWLKAAMDPLRIL